MLKRQLWDLPVSSTSAYSTNCSPFTLPSGGVLALASDMIVTLTTNIVYQPACTGGGDVAEGISTINGPKDPFYASSTPQTYVIAATTVIAWILVVMLIITPRTNFLGNPGAGPGFGSGHGIIGGATGGVPSLIGVGSRPWLQKVAALGVAVSLTIATADTFKVAQHQYYTGFMNADELHDEVMGSLEIRITRVISDVFLWLAQVQTLIRLFPRHKEKVLIKWTGFALIVCDSTFSSLNSFMIDTYHRPRHFVDAVPALSYLFQLALGLLYAAWVMYYATTKRRYAFYHSKMRDICLIATLSLVAILTPVIFFVTDVSNQDVASWGDYFRWVGAAAASVVVWEWVERIEALERDEKKDGILGREIFDGDEMLDALPSERPMWGNGRRKKRLHRRGGGGGGGGGDDENNPSDANHTNALDKGLNGIAQRFRRTQQRAQEHFPLGRAHSITTTATPEASRTMNEGSMIRFGNLPKPGQPNAQDPPPDGPTPPPAVASPISTAESASAASTVYVVRYDVVADTPQPVRRRTDRDANANTAPRDADKEDAENEAQPNRHRGQQSKWHSVPNPFKRKRASPPAEVQQARLAAAAPPHTSRSATPAHNFSRWDVKNRLGVLAAETGECIRDRQEGRRPEAGDLPVVTVIPAQPRGSGRTWSPEDSSRQGGIVGPAPVAALAEGGCHSTENGGSGSTTLTANSDAEPVPLGRAVRAEGESSSLGAGGAGAATVAVAPSRHAQQQQPSPRADDVAARTEALTIVPAPRRSPLHIIMSASSEGEEEGGSPAALGLARKPADNG
ncbi:hypothetical protein LTR08_001490 [Meristemomyces frigidus]|nr:hypothetical protein LTR08_001490 [Meristemomyces frigidus]